MQRARPHAVPLEARRERADALDLRHKDHHARLLPAPPAAAALAAATLLALPSAALHDSSAALAPRDAHLRERRQQGRPPLPARAEHKPLPHRRRHCRQTKRLAAAAAAAARRLRPCPAAAAPSAARASVSQ